MLQLSSFKKNFRALKMPQCNWKCLADAKYRFLLTYLKRNKSYLCFNLNPLYGFSFGLQKWSLKSRQATHTEMNSNLLPSSLKRGKNSFLRYQGICLIRIQNPSSESKDYGSPKLKKNLKES